MSKKLMTVIAAGLAIIAAVAIYRALFIRTVNYNIGGIDIPARYNMLTGKAVPIAGYKGKPIKRTVTDRNNDRIGLDRNDVTAAKFRWELFEGWIKSRPEYKGWESDPDIFRKADEEFKKKVQANVKVVK
ncbi:MAG: hypothetical protein V1682_06845 [Candidatus Omnitrophota bacterium]